VLLRGLAVIAFGVLTWLLPGISLATLALLFGFVLFDLAFRMRTFDKQLIRLLKQNKSRLVMQVDWAPVCSLGESGPFL